MKKKINILINKEAKFLGLYYGYWNWFFLFKEDLKELDLEVNFYSNINKKFLEADYLFLNSRSLPKNNEFIDIAYIKKLYSKNSMEPDIIISDKSPSYLNPGEYLLIDLRHILNNLILCI